MTRALGIGAMYRLVDPETTATKKCYLYIINPAHQVRRDQPTCRRGRSATAELEASSTAVPRVAGASIGDVVG